MAGSSLLALLDDITTLLDDVASLTQIAARKTAGVMGDDLALNAEQVTGLKADRELPVVWAVAKGSFWNKVILVPAALVISAFLPAAITPLLMLGGAFLCYEGFEKVMHKFTEHDDEPRRAQRIQALADPTIDLVALERDRIKGAIRTDFILSAEILVIALGTMATAAMSRQIVTLTVIGLGVTVLVYGLVAGIVKLDDLGLSLTRTPKDETGADARRSLGAIILKAAPRFLRLLSIVGTTAMFLVGGSILAHGIAPVEHLISDLAASAAQRAPWMGTAVQILAEGATGVIAGGLIVGCVSFAKRLIPQRTASTA